MNTLNKNNVPLIKDGKILRFGKITEDYIAYWKFDDNYNEETGTYSATPYNSPIFDTGKFGQCLVLDSSSTQYVTTNLSTSDFCSGTSSGTVSFWFKNNEIINNSYIMGACELVQQPSIGYEPIPPQPFGITLGFSEDYYYQANMHYADGGFEITPDLNWHHIVMRNDIDSSINYQVYYDGNKVYEMEYTSLGPLTDFNITIGRRGNDNENYYSGCIEHLRIYDYAITDTKIAELYNE